MFSRATFIVDICPLSISTRLYSFTINLFVVSCSSFPWYVVMIKLSHSVVRCPFGVLPLCDVFLCSMLLHSCGVSVSCSVLFGVLRVHGMVPKSSRWCDSSSSYSLTSLIILTISKELIDTINHNHGLMTKTKLYENMHDPPPSISMHFFLFL